MADEELIRHHIVPDPLGIRAGDARLRNSGAPVWAVIWDWHARSGDAARVLEDYQLSPEELDAALAYYRKHQAAVDARLEVNGLRTA